MTKIIFIGLLLIAAFFAGQVTTSLLYKGGNLKIPAGQQAFTHLSPEQFNAELSTGEYTLLDVRTGDEYAAGHLKNALQADYYQTQQFSDYLETLNKNSMYLIYCRTGIRSGKAMQVMQDKGFKNVSDLAGGYNAWVAENLSTVVSNPQ